VQYGSAQEHPAQRVGQSGGMYWQEASGAAAQCRNALQLPAQ
jgi:hypothetical protein